MHISRSPNADNEDLLLFSQKDFNKCQSIHREELEQIQEYVNTLINIRNQINLFKVLQLDSY